MGEIYGAMKDLKREERDKLEPKRFERAKEVLLAIGCDLGGGPDAAMTVSFKTGRKFHFWPYSGWFNEIGGKAKGRGLANLKRIGQEISKADKVAHVKAGKQNRNHTCHWPGCEKQVPPAMWGCKGHWFTLPRNLRDKIWMAYKPGQEITMTPSREYIDAANEVQEWIKTQALKVGDIIQLTAEAKKIRNTTEHRQGEIKGFYKTYLEILWDGALNTCWYDLHAVEPIPEGTRVAIQIPLLDEAPKASDEPKDEEEDDDEH